MANYIEHTADTLFTSRDMAHHLNNVGATLIHNVVNINAHRDSVPRQEWFENHISDVWISPITYYNFRYGASCQYMVFGLPFALSDEIVPVYRSNPRPYDVARVLLASVRGRPNAPPNLQGVRPPREILHKIEQDWEPNWETLPSKYDSPELDLFQLLAVSPPPCYGGNVPPMTDLITLKHFFSSLPQPFIELDRELRVEIARQFNRTIRLTQDQHLGTLGKVFERAKGSDEKRVLVRLCKLLERYPAEGSRIFSKPLFRTEVCKMSVQPIHSRVLMLVDRVRN
jgi:hypothetical protein